MPLSFIVLLKSGALSIDVDQYIILFNQPKPISYTTKKKIKKTYKVAL